MTLREAAGARVQLGGTRPRRLLAGLALHAGEVVSADRLTDIVWGDCPPRSARQNLHTYLWSLRGALTTAGTGSRVVIEACHPGYVLRASPGALDWDCFRDLSASAAGLLPGDPGKAGALLRSALDLWRGQVAADVEGLSLSLEARIAAMEEARIAALEQRIEADLAIGRHRALAAELAELVARYPLRERFRALQMTALYRCGRQAEAQAAFHQLRHDLATELGVGPTVQLRALYEAMLRADPLVAGVASPHGLVAGSLAHTEDPSQPSANQADSPGGAIAAAPTTTTLGQRVAAEEARLFQGRATELRRVLDLLAASSRLPRVIQLHGPPGIGKTAFVQALARRCDARDWPTVIIDSRDFGHDPVELANAISRRSAEAWSPTCGRPLLLVLDTAEEMRDIEHHLWDAVLPGLQGSVLAMLCTRRPTPVLARSPMWRGLVDQIELPPLSQAEARRLIWLLGIRDPAAADSIIRFARGNPLFLTVAAQYAWSAGPADLEVSGEAARSLVARMTREIADSQMRKLLEAASVVRTFNEELLAAMVGRDDARSFDALCALSFVRAVPSGARLHDLVRESIAADLRWRSPRACQRLRQRAYHYLAQGARAAPDAGPYIQELLHLAADSAPWARYYAPADHPGVHIRPVHPDDLPRLTRLCHTGITRFGYPPAERARQLEADFPVAVQHFAVALNDAGAITGFAYTMPLNSDTWRTAAKTREAFFATLPEPELAAVKASRGSTSRARLVAGATHLPGYEHLNDALKQALFYKSLDRQTLAGRYVAYHLLTPDSPELPQIIAAGLLRRTRNIQDGGCLADEWLLEFGDGGLIGWIGEVLGISPSGEVGQVTAADELPSAKSGPSQS